MTEKEDVEDINVPEFVRGEEVEVWDDNYFDAKKAKYVGTVDHEFKYIVEFDSQSPLCYKHIRKLHPTGEVKKFTRDEIRKVLPNETATIVEIATIQNIVFGVFEQLGILAD